MTVGRAGENLPNRVNKPAQSTARNGVYKPLGAAGHVFILVTPTLVSSEVERPPSQSTTLVKPFLQAWQSHFGPDRCETSGHRRQRPYVTFARRRRQTSLRPRICATTPKVTLRPVLGFRRSLPYLLGGTRLAGGRLRCLRLRSVGVGAVARA